MCDGLEPYLKSINFREQGITGLKNSKIISENQNISDIKQYIWTRTLNTLKLKIIKINHNNNNMAMKRKVSEDWRAGRQINFTDLISPSNNIKTLSRKMYNSSLGAHEFLFSKLAHVV